ncbi:DNA alkylation repair protein [Flammeovirgaceae bacterium 311]|nr:DNA alkylation repair protein [Flammeovirgaceae bacterium 311]
MEAFTNSTLENVQQALRQRIRPEKAAHYPKFFQAHAGGYGEGDHFLGVVVPDNRAIARAHWQQLEPEALSPLLLSTWHEERLCGLFMLLERYKKSKTEAEKEACVQCYLQHLPGVNNWDLVDATAYDLLGHWLLKRERSLLYTFAAAGDLWRQRIAVVATLAFIRKGQFTDTLKLAEKLMQHRHPLMHKAIGWMLRESGKKDELVLVEFLDQHYKNMPRTMLRYAIERFPENRRKAYLKGAV